MVQCNRTLQKGTLTSHLFLLTSHLFLHVLKTQIHPPGVHVRVTLLFLLHKGPFFKNMIFVVTGTLASRKWGDMSGISF